MLFFTIFAFCSHSSRSHLSQVTFDQSKFDSVIVFFIYLIFFFQVLMLFYVFQSEASKQKSISDLMNFSHSRFVFALIRLESKCFWFMKRNTIEYLHFVSILWFILPLICPVHVDHCSIESKHPNGIDILSMYSIDSAKLFRLTERFQCPIHSRTYSKIENQFQYIRNTWECLDVS